MRSPTVPRRAYSVLLTGVLALVVCASTADPPGAEGAAPTAARGLLHNGDSLAVGTQPYLRGALPGWHVRASDDPRATGVFRRAIRQTMSVAGRRRCVVWANIVRPPAAWAGYGRMHRVLAQEARRKRNLRVFQWARMARVHRAWFGPDRVHPSGVGYAARTRGIARGSPLSLSGSGICGDRGPNLCWLAKGMGAPLSQRPRAGRPGHSASQWRTPVVLCLAMLASLLYAGEATAGNVVSFSAPVTTSLPPNGSSVATGDFNSDGDPDLAVASDASNSVSILLGGLAGTFSAPLTLTVPGGATAVAVGEFDGNSDPDLAVVGTGGTISTFLGAPGSAFTTGQTMTVTGSGGCPAFPCPPSGSFPVDVAIGDLNGDNDPEIVVANQGSDNVAIFTGADAARFIPTPLFVPVGDAPGSVAIGNFNGEVDSDPDLAVTNHGPLSSPAADTVSILTGTGGTAISFSAPANVTVGDYPDDVVAGDFNGDKDPDLAVVNTGSGTTGPFTVSILTGGTGSAFTVTSTLTGGSRAIALGDFNADGDLDLVTVGNSGNNLAVFVGSSGATFLAAQNFPGGVASQSLAVADFNGDLRPDVAAANYSPAGVSTVLNTSDLTPPDTTITSGPTGATNDSTPTFTFTSSEAGSTFQCRTGTGLFAACTSPHTTAALADGARTFEVRAVDAAGNIDPTPALRNLTIDATPPDTTIQTGPSGPTNDNTPTFTFSSEAGASFQCRTDPAAAFVACTSPHTTAALADGARTFEVRAVDAAGNPDPTPASRSLSVDTAAPETTIVSGPSGATNDNTPTFTFSSEAGASFQCRVNAAAFAPCTSPHTTAALADGASTFEVRAIDAAGNVDATPASRAVNVDAAAPDTVIASGPSGPTNDSTPTFTFTASKPGSTFECRVGAAVFAPCTSPHTTAALSDGPKTFEVRAIDAVGNADPVTATRTFTVDTTPPETSINAGPTGTTSDSSPTFAFSSTERGARFQCRLDEGAWLPCSSPHTLPVLSAGSHTFRVRSIDAAGNVDASPASTLDPSAALRSFTIAAAAPGPPILGRTFNAEPVKGDVFVSVPPGTGARASASVPGLKGRNFIPLREARQVPVGSIFDTRKGTVRLTSARNTRGVTQSGDFLGGVFQVLQSRRRSAKGLTELRLKGASFRGCGRATGKRASAAASRRRIRRLRGSGRGRFRTRGRYSAATVRGTIWTVTDRCDGTLTKVTRGKVAVRDLRRRRTILLRAGKSYFARARR